MDELKLVFATKWMRGIVTRIIKKAIFKKTGYEVDVQINKIIVETNEGKVSLKLDAEANMNKDDFVGLIKQIGVI